MRINCLKAKEKIARKQYEIEGIFQVKKGTQVPFYMMVLPHHATFQTLADEEGTRVTEMVSRHMGEPSSGPTVVKGGACGGEVGELADELDVHGAMMSVVWDGGQFDREDFIQRFKKVVEACLQKD